MLSTKPIPHFESNLHAKSLLIGLINVLKRILPNYKMENDMT